MHSRITHWGAASGRHWGLAALALMVGLAPVSAAFAQKKPPEIKKAAKPDANSDRPTARTHPTNPMIWDVETMTMEAVEQIAKRYNLTGAQEDFTRLLLTQRVNAFLDKYEMDVRELLHESIMLKTGQIERSTANLQDWSRRALPVYKAAQEAILQGNTEWGAILTDEQKELHHRDLDKMEESFGRVTGQLVAWSEGREWNPNQPQGQQPQLANAEEGRVSENPPAPAQADLEDTWTLYVNRFIETYRLDESQQNSARKKILKEHQAEARKIRDARQEQFLRIKKLLASPDGEKRRPVLLREERQLERPIYDEFKKLARRLDGLPRAEQQRGVDPILEKELSELREKFSTPPSIEEPKVQTGTLPAPSKQQDPRGEASTKPASPEKPADQPKEGSDETSGGGGDGPSDSSAPSADASKAKADSSGESGDKKKQPADE